MFERFTERARRVIILARGEAEKYQHEYLGTEHLLLGLIRENEGIAAQVLMNLGIKLDEVREEVLEFLGASESGDDDNDNSESSSSSPTLLWPFPVVPTAWRLRCLSMAGAKRRGAVSARLSSSMDCALNLRQKRR